VTRHADHAIFGEQLARHADADGIEGKMDAVGVGRNCNVDAIVHEEWCAVARADLAKAESELVELARGKIFLAQLQRYRAGRCDSLRGRE